MVEDLTSDFGPENTILVNVGDCFTNKPGADTLKERAHLMFDVFDMMGMDVYGVGTKDLVFGSDFLLEEDKKRSFDFLCANMLKKKDSKPYFKPYVVLKRGGKRFLIAQVMDTGSELLDKDTEYADPVGTLNKIKKTVEHDVFIPILYTSKEHAKLWLETLEGVDMAIVGAHLGVLDKKEFSNNVLFVYNNFKGRSMFWVDVKIDDTSKVSINGPFYKEVRETTIPEDKKITEMIQAFKKRNGLDKIKANPKTVYYQENYYYVGKDWCVRCHEEIVDSWSKTKHAHAMDTLIKAGKQDDPECFKCHVTAVMDKKSGKYAGEFISMDANPNMANVQCETCHGMADVHTINPTDWFGHEVTPEVCAKCHTPERDPDFDYERDLKKSMHVKMIKKVEE